MTSPVRAPFKQRFIQLTILFATCSFLCFIGFLLRNNVSCSSSLLEMPNDKNDYMELWKGPFTTERMLETLNLSSSLPRERRQQRGSISLAMGEVLSSLNIEVHSIAMSKDFKTAFVTIYYSGTLKIIDVSDCSAPKILSSLHFHQSSFNYQSKVLVLSNDGKTLYLRSDQYLEIVNVSDLKSPILINSHRTSSPSSSLGLPYLPMAIAKNDQTLFIAGLGLQIVNISNPEKIHFIPAFNNETFLSGSIFDFSISKDEKTLYLVNGTLHIFNISDLTDVKWIASYQTKGETSSIKLSQKVAGIVFTTGTGSEGSIIVEKVDVTDPQNPKEITNFENKVTGQSLPSILAISPDEAHVYIYSKNSQNQGDEFFVADIEKKKVEDNNRSSIEAPYAMVFHPNGKRMFTVTRSRFVIVDLITEYPNDRIFGLTNYPVAKLEIPNLGALIGTSSDSKTLFLSISTKKYGDHDKIFEIWNISDVKIPSKISSITLDCEIESIKVSKDDKRSYLLCQEIFYIVDISDLTNPNIIGSIEAGSSIFFTDVDVSKDGQTGFTLQGVNIVQIVTWNFSVPSEPKEISRLNIDKEYYGKRIFVSKDDKTLFTVGDNITLYNISDVTSMHVLAIFPMETDQGTVEILDARLSEDEKTLFIETRDEAKFHRLKIVDISDLLSPKPASSLDLPKLLYNPPNDNFPFWFSFDRKLIYFVQTDGLLGIDISDLTAPKPSHVLPLSNKMTPFIKGFVFSEDEKTGYFLGKDELLIVDFHLNDTVFFYHDKFLLGNHYAETVTLLRMDNYSDYTPVDRSSFKFIKAFLLDFDIMFNENSTRFAVSPLPNWINFYEDIGVFTIEPKSQGNLGSYSFCSVFSNQLSLNAFDGVVLKVNFTTENLLIRLTSLGYVDNQRFVTSKFGEFQYFLLGSEYSAEIKQQVYDILNKHRVETCTKFDILPSLSWNVSSSKRISINTPSLSSVKVDIKLNCDARFISKTYGSLYPVITEEKSRLSLQGSLKEVNTALKEIILNFDENNDGDISHSYKNCGILSVTDSLNPDLENKILRDIDKLFIHNREPKENKNLAIQSQIDVSPVYTGEYFTLSLDPKTFQDLNNLTLAYELRGFNHGERLPEWIKFNNLTIKGVPPEDLLNREVPLRIVAKNEFKETEVQFTIHIKISMMYAIKLLVKISPYLLTVLGFIIKANMIYNIVFKKFYKHSKEFSVRIGEQITTETVFPVMFVYEENLESKLILRFMEKYVMSELRKNSISKEELARYFADDHIISKERVSEAIQKTIKTVMPSKYKMRLDLYLDTDSVSRQIIFQLILDKLTMWYLESKKEKVTRRCFHIIKGRWSEIVQWDTQRSIGFLINQGRFDQILSEIDGEVMLNERISRQNTDLDKSLLFYEGERDRQINKSLLKNAILAYASEQQQVNLLAIKAKISMKQKMKSNFLFRFFKIDLQSIHYADKAKAGQGVNYKIENDILYLNGSAGRKFRSKTIVLQIAEEQQRIMKEIYIHCIPDPSLDETTMMVRGIESVYNDKNYEVF